MTRRRSLPSLLLAGGFALAVLLLLPAAPRAGAAEEAVQTERWYEILRDGQKLGHARVVWAPSTWEGKATVHDTTVSVQKSVRNMMGMRDVFEVVSTVDLERGDDGSLWWMRVVVEEAGRTTTEELTWTGSGYDHVSRLGEEERTLSIPLDAPVVTDAESFLGEHVRGGTLEPGARFELRLLDVTARGVRLHQLEVLGREEMLDRSVAPDDEGNREPVACWKVREVDPQSGGTTLFWIDDDGAFVQLVGEGGSSWRRVAKGDAEATPVKPYEHSITTPSTPVLERVMSAERLDLDLFVQGDATRPLPVLPDSGWGRVVGVSGSDESGWIVKMELTKHDVAGVEAPWPLEIPEGFERYLESTVLVTAENEQVRQLARSVVGDAKDARTAAERLARWVHENLEKKSPEVAQASALEILESREGDCSEHALLFLTMCRAVGIPARGCSGYVNVGSMWGSHAWCEIWLGAWVGADPTTGEVGTGARYLFFGYDDDPESFPGLVTARLRGRMRFVATRIVEGGDDYELQDAQSWHLEDAERGRYVHVLAGIEARDAPRDWVVRMTGANRCRVRGPDLRAEMSVSADQGFTLSGFGGADTTFAGAPARRIPIPGQGVAYIVHSRRRMIQLVLRSEAPDEAAERLAKVFAPTFAPVPPPPPGADDGHSDPDSPPPDDAR